MLADSHAHLDHHAFDPDRAQVLQRARGAGVLQLVIPAVDAASWPRIRDLCATQPLALFPAYGLHPLYLHQHALSDVDALSSWCTSNAAIAIGEIGLDFHLAELDPVLQRHYFDRQLALARELDLPVIVHARQALEEVILTLRRHPGVRGVVHSFSGSEEQARRLWQLGFLVGIGGPVTYDRAQRLRRIVADMPSEFLLLESDAPDQPDAGHRGQRNEPARVADVLRCVAALRGEAECDLAAVTAANTRRLFRLPDPDRA
ncbi:MULTISPECIES: TatD family hydrolase [Rhodanobacter]|uniref:TatD family hydrolase n=1 Tax=Rhodanobacter hydrolyticus TaxID=2250595 RepID=A0ABW8J6F9_9GAMM|nr:TatD family hydrolase [Rhodanobacter sp. 7MK24]MBD8879477.1 TatD family hydrolase [Rhodanobacter sp. 7MK24]